MSRLSLRKEADVVPRLAATAAVATERIREGGVETIQKGDGTPLTQADIVSQAIVLSGLRRDFPDDGVLAEEEASNIEKGKIRERACRELRDMGIPCTEEELSELVNYRGNLKGARTWMIDPIDGTKGFRKGLPYAICIGLYFEGRPQFGCLAVPLFPDREGRGKGTVIVYGGKQVGAYVLEGGQDRPRKIRVSGIDRLSHLRLTGSREHDFNNMCKRFMAEAGMESFVSMDGATKYALLALGRVDVYFRTAEPGFGIGFPWDHCAGEAVVEGAGGRVTGFSGSPLSYDQQAGSPMRDVKGLLASNAVCHEDLLDIVRRIL